MVTSERTAGSMPSWDKPIGGKEASFSEIMSFQAEKNAFSQDVQADNDKSFSFADLVDMLNPLQHIPLLNILYREITGDEIKPIGSIIGGGIFGGPLGAASGIVNAIVKEETGKDIAGNAVSFVSGSTAKKHSSDTSKERQAYSDLPAALLNFSEKPKSI